MSEYMAAQIDKQIEGGISENDRLQAINADLAQALEEITEQYRLLLLERFDPQHQHLAEDSPTLRTARAAIAKARP